MSKVVKVRRVVTIEYTAPLEHYPDMTEEQALDFEREPATVELAAMLEDVTGQAVTAWIEDES